MRPSMASQRTHPGAENVENLFKVPNPHSPLEVELKTFVLTSCVFSKKINCNDFKK